MPVWETCLLAAVQRLAARFAVVLVGRSHLLCLMEAELSSFANQTLCRFYLRACWCHILTYISVESRVNRLIQWYWSSVPSDVLVKLLFIMFRSRVCLGLFQNVTLMVDASMLDTHSTVDLFCFFKPSMTSLFDSGMFWVNLFICW